MTVLPAAAAALRQAAHVPAEIPVLPDDEQARHWATEELSKGVYQQAKPSLFDQIVQGIAEWLGSLFDDITGVEANLGWIIITVGVLLLIGLAIWLIKPRLNRRRQQQEMFDGGVLLTAEQHRAAGGEAAARGEFGQAALEQFRAIVRSAEERSVLDPQPGRTAAEVATQLESAFPGQRKPLQDAALGFNDVRYGGAAGSRAEFDRLLELDRELLTARPVYADMAADPLSLR
ncbi:MAG TPA: DUF4129 domain-containing protein [Arthrobacter sp.]|nr:DUF4129 domain-containing protein [Arthrobacter sp.]